MKIYKVINNNMVSIRNNQGQEMMFKGLSIGFKKKPGDDVDETKIEMRFVLENSTLTRRFNEMIVNVDQQVIDICMDAITMIKGRSKIKLRDSIYVTLIDHVSNLIDRLNANITFDNSILWNISRIYPAEYELAKQTVDMLREKLPYKIDADEANFIALHIVNAEVASDMNTTYKLTNAINDICDIVSSDLHTEREEDNYDYNRFVMHVRFMLENSGNETPLSNSVDSKTLDTLISNYPAAWESVKKISAFIAVFLNRQLSKKEQLYLMIHLTQLYDRYSS
ncbi:PRD domain-containing protein [Listeria grayi]|uniref:PRD domain-containing protein n=1 Tax=Listeria grayi TaxID=1641 RepID=UPI0016272FFB|nr:PRD domain-containing protein [Listeria grayi]MBC1921605.1 PRD domain-containing protein [Listeria grayi]